MAKRERVIFVKDLDDVEAKRVTTRYKNIIVFSEHDGKNGVHHDIYKGGINYTTFSDVDKDMNNFALHGNSIVLQKTDERMLKFVEHKTVLIGSLNGRQIDSNVYELSTSSDENYLKLSSDMTLTAENIHVIIGKELINASIDTHSNTLMLKPKKLYNSGIGTSIVKIAVDEDKFSYVIVNFVLNDDENNISINLNYAHVYIYMGQQIQLSALVIPETYRHKHVLFESADNNICTIDGNGIIRALSCGDTTVTVSMYANPNIYATCIVSVVEDEYVVSDSLVDHVVGGHVTRVNDRFGGMLTEKKNAYDRMIDEQGTHGDSRV